MSRPRFPTATVLASGLLRAALCFSWGVFASPASASVALPVAASWHPLGQPLPRSGHAAIYDPVRQRMIVVGGNSPYTAAEVWVLDLSGSDSWSLLEANDALPVGSVQAAYDESRDRIVAVTTALDTLYALPLGGALAWQRTPLTGGAGHRRGTSVTLDPAHDRLVAIGGYDAATATYHNDVWELPLSGPFTWVELHPSGTPPSPRLEHSCTYDPARDRMIVFAGDSDHGILDDTWALDLGGAPAWQEIPAAADSLIHRYKHRAVYDPAGDQLLVYGGGSSGGGVVYAHRSVCALDLVHPTAWTHAVGNRPGRLDDFSMVLDPLGRRLVVFGGNHPADCDLRETWQAPLDDLASWSLTFPGLGGPNYRRAAIAYDSRHQRLEVQGGRSYCHNETVGGVGYTLWLDEEPQWSPPHGVLTRFGHTMIYDAGRDRFVSFGGQDEHGDSWNDIHVWTDPGPWTELAVTGAPPPALGAYSDYDAARDRMWIWQGGATLWYLDLDDSSWHRIDPAGGVPVSGSLLVDPVTGDVLVREFPSGYLWRLNEAGPSWDLLATSGIPPVGGYTLIDSLAHALFVLTDHAYVMSLDDLVWRPLPVTGQWPAWTLALALKSAARRIVVAGAVEECERHCDYSGVWELTFEQDNPTPVLIQSALAGWSGATLRVHWDTSLEGERAATVLKRTPESPWTAVATVQAGTDGGIDYLDSDARSDRRYGYALALDPLHLESLVGEVWSDALLPRSLALEPPSPNPSSGPLLVRFTLPVTSRAMLEVLDLQGRRMLERVIFPAQAGSQSVMLVPGRALAPGIYLLRLTQAGRSVTRRFARVR